MGILEFFKKNSKTLVVAGGLTALVGGLIYILSLEEEQKSDIQTLNQQNTQDEQITISEQEFQAIEAKLGQNEHLQNMSAEERRKIIQETVQMKQLMRKEIILEIMPGTQCLSPQTVKKVFLRSIDMTLDNLIKVRDEYVVSRQKCIDDLERYAQLCLELFQIYLKLLNQGVSTIITLLDIDLNYFVECQKFLQQRQLLKASYLKDLSWHIMSEKKSMKVLNLQDYKDMLKFQIEEFEKQTEIVKPQMLNLDTNQLRLVINCRVDDVTFMEKQISDYDQVKYLRFYIEDSEIVQLLKNKSEQIERIQKQ